MKKLLLSALIFTLSAQSAFAFSDVEEDYFAAGAIERLQSTAIVEGYEDDSFRPENPINRAEFLKIVMEAMDQAGRLDPEIAGSDCFPDVQNQWFAKYVCTASQIGLIDGYEDGWFRPEREINFVEASKILVNAFGLEPVYDLDYLDSWFERYVVALENKVMIPPTIYNFDKKITRADMSYMVARVFGWSPAWSDLEKKHAREHWTYTNIRAFSQLGGDPEPLGVNVGQNVWTAFYRVFNRVYLVSQGKYTEVLGADPDSFRVLGDFNDNGTHNVKPYTDGQFLYFVHLGFSGDVDIFNDGLLDIETVERIDHPYFYGQFLADKNAVYFFELEHEVENYLRIPGLTQENFHPLDGEMDGFIFHDGETVYLIERVPHGMFDGQGGYRGDLTLEELEGLDPASFEYLNRMIVKDASAVYYVNVGLNSGYSDFNDYYFDEPDERLIEFPDLDAASLELMDIGLGVEFIFSDVNGVHIPVGNKFVRIEGADPETFQFDGLRSDEYVGQEITAGNYGTQYYFYDDDQAWVFVDDLLGEDSITEL